MSPGDLVLCLNDTPPADYNDAPRLHVGATYTVLESVRRGEVDGLLVEEARFPHGLGRLEHGWRATRFALLERAS